MENNNITSEEIILHSVNMANLAINSPENVKMDLLHKYELLAGSKSGINLNTILDNAYNYSVICNKTLFITLINTRKPVELAGYKNLNTEMLAAIKENNGDRNIGAVKKLYDRLNKVLKDNNIEVNQIVTPTELQTAIQTFGVAQAEPEEVEELEDIMSDDPDIDELISDIDFDEDIDINTDTSGEEELEDENDDITLDDEAITEGDGSIFEVDELENDLNADSSEDTKSDEDYLEAFRQIYEGEDVGSMTPLRSAIDGIMKSLEELYASCFSGITSPDGILTDKGLLSLDRVHGKYKFLYNHADYTPSSNGASDYKNPEYIKYSQNKGRYGQYYKAVMYALGVTLGGASTVSRTMTPDARNNTINEAVRIAENVFGTRIDGRKSILPRLEDAQNTIHYYPRLHTQFMTGNFTVSNDMQKWAEENKVHRNQYKITNFGDLMKWARKQVSQCLTQALIDAGLKIEDAGMNDGQVTSICQLMSKNIKNIIVITNEKTKKFGYFTVKICTGENINVNILSNNISEYFNSASDGSKSAEIIIKNDGSNSGVIEFDIVLNRSDYDKSSSFSADIIDDIIETGNVPSWSNAILGEKNNGGALNYNFKKNYSISVYGSSGSGKGIMTSALLSNAIAEGCEVLYMDGKPDNGVALGKIAWDAGMDCAIFNANSGKAVGGCAKTFPDYLENYSHGIRDLSIRTDMINKIPCLDDNNDWPFKSKDILSRTLLYEVSLALNGFEFVHDAIISRSQGNIEKNPDGSDRWAVFVIDEIENAASNENTIRSKMKAYMDKVGEQEVYKEESKTDKNGNVTTQQKRNGKIKDPKNWSKDTGYLFCKQWLDWADHVCSNWDSVVTISLRNSSSTLITIFQTNKWFNQSGAVSTGSTRIGQLMLRLAPKTIKIVGKGALVAKNQWGDEPKYDWSEEVARGKWVVASNEGNLTNSDQVFKPFKVFTTDLGDGVPVPLDDYGCGSNECYTCRDDIGKATSTGKLKKPLGLQSYIKYLFNSLSDEIQQQMSEGKRMPGTETPEGVLNTSLKYFDTLSPTGSLLSRMYDVKPISNFNGQISEDEAAEIFSRTETSEADELSDLNSSLNQQSNEDMTPANNGNNDTSEYMQNTGNTSQNTGGMTDDEAFEGMGSSGGSFAGPRRHVDVPKFTYAATIARMNLDNDTLAEYLRKYNIVNRLINNSFVYSDRTNVAKGNNLKIASVIASTYVYISNKLGLGRQDVISNAFQQINNNNNSDYRYSFLIGMIQALDSGELQYDAMPTQDQMREWSNQFIAVQPTQNVNPVNSFDVADSSSQTVNSGQTSESLGARILRLSETVCRNRNWTADQLLKFQRTLLEKMGVQ